MYFFQAVGKVVVCGIYMHVGARGGRTEGHGSPTTASRAVKRLFRWIPLMSFGLRLSITDAFGSVTPLTSHQLFLYQACVHVALTLIVRSIKGVKCGPPKRDRKSVSRRAR